MQQHMYHKGCTNKLYSIISILRRTTPFECMMQHEPVVETHQNHQSDLCRLQLTPGRLLPFAGPSVRGLAIEHSATLRVFAGPARTTACVNLCMKQLVCLCTDSSRVQSTDEAVVSTTESFSTQQARYSHPKANGHTVVPRCVHHWQQA